MFLFLVFDFFDRIDNFIAAGASPVSVIEYFVFKVPLMLNLMLPVAMLVATMFTLGILSKNSEITAMRASGLTVFWIAKPIYILGIVLSLLSILMNETFVPYASRRVAEIYNIDIRQKDKTGRYSQTDFWWRTKDTFYSVNTFDSRVNTLLGFSIFRLSKDFDVVKRTDADTVEWLKPSLGWQMSDVN